MGKQTQLIVSTRSVTAIVCLWAVFAVPQSIFAQEIILRSDSMPTSGIVRLADVAEVRGLEPAAAERLGRLPLMPTPAAGTQRYVTMQGIADMLAAQGEDVSQFKLSGSRRVAVQAPRAATPPATADNVPDDKAARMAALALGRVAVANSEDRGAESESVEAPVGPPVAVTVRAVPRGAIITAADVEVRQLERVPVASSRRSPIYEINELIGMEAGRAIQAGEVIFSDAIRKPTLVKRGDTVTVFAQGGGFRVRTSARAAQEGGQGDLVQVESVDTKEKFDARVIGLREVGVLASPRDVTNTPVSRPASATAPFRRYLQASQESDKGRGSAAFRKYQALNGATNGEIR